ncbi:hypothetical protein PAAG_05190 [Paracoccidioides lutzii Pb01]|uniref:Uncharacterized protein n=1 Tax=Paracoccidioides lutzii (strain ATCC MYA-826 / Pb01) TaxID=502779 RepID=C1H347_PARBA|nr:hypothetical protein PAAG_05190 [Paracoccidioides lutzii Pb01]EEH34141.2 hypothetical protein PAAG_05190 [Paracoccidioides lutzii Pb01]
MSRHEKKVTSEDDAWSSMMYFSDGAESRRSGIRKDEEKNAGRREEKRRGGEVEDKNGATPGQHTRIDDSTHTTLTSKAEGRRIVCSDGTRVLPVPYFMCHWSTPSTAKSNLSGTSQFNVNAINAANSTTTDNSDNSDQGQALDWKKARHKS